MNWIYTSNYSEIFKAYEEKSISLTELRDILRENLKSMRKELPRSISRDRLEQLIDDLQHWQGSEDEFDEEILSSLYDWADSERVWLEAQLAPRGEQYIATTKIRKEGVVDKEKVKESIEGHPGRTIGSVEGLIGIKSKRNRQNKKCNWIHDTRAF